MKTSVFSTCELWIDFALAGMVAQQVPLPCHLIVLHVLSVSSPVSSHCPKNMPVWQNLASGQNAACGPVARGFSPIIYDR